MIWSAGCALAACSSRSIASATSALGSPSAAEPPCRAPGGASSGGGGARPSSRPCPGACRRRRAAVAAGAAGGEAAAAADHGHHVFRKHLADTDSPPRVEWVGHALAASLRCVGLADVGAVLAPLASTSPARSPRP